MPVNGRRLTAAAAVLSAIGMVACGSPEVHEQAKSPVPLAPRQAPPDAKTLIARAAPLELATPYEPPPGDPLEHNTSGYAKTMCSAVFITGLDPDVAAESVGYFTGPYASAEEGRQAGRRSREERSPDHAAERRHRDGALLRIAGLHRAAPRPRRRVLHAESWSRAICPTRRRLRGRWATSLPERRRRRPASTRTS